jgi:hypothetical protein
MNMSFINAILDSLKLKLKMLLGNSTKIAINL